MACIVIAAGCASVPAGEHAEHRDDCHAAFVAFANAVPKLQPLPAGCRVADAASAMHALGTTSTGELGYVDRFTVHDFATPNDNVLPHAELVWPSRGVVVISDSASMASVLRVGIFVPCTLAEYEKVRPSAFEHEEREE